MSKKSESRNKTKHSISEEQRLFAANRQLYKEFDDICFQYRLKIKKPFIEIVGPASFWGRWDPLLGKIEIASELVLQHPWQHVLAVFKHEIAHQIVHQQYKKDASDHGKEFQKACESIGLEPYYRRASTDFSHIALDDPSLVATNNTTKEEARLQKLLQLSQSDNINEASLALKRAQDLMRKYDISSDQLDKQHFRSLLLKLNKKRLNRNYSLIASLLVNYFDVEAVFTEYYDSSMCEAYKGVDLIGAEHKLKVAEYVFYFLSELLPRLCKEQNIAVPKRASYTLGVLKGIEQQLQNAIVAEARSLTPQPTKNANSTVLIKKEKALIQEQLGFKYPRLTQQRRAQTRVQIGAFYQGQQKGKSVSLKEGLKKSAKNILKLLQ